MKSTPRLKKMRDGISNVAASKRNRTPRAERRWRVEIINENTLARVLSLRLTGIRARVALIAAVASIFSLVVVLFTFTPLGKWIWGEPDLHTNYVHLSLKLDSISAVARAHEAYTANLVAIFSDSVAADSLPASVPVAAVTDTLIDASEAERRFVEKFEADRRFNLSVLSPIAAEGMIFESPVASVDHGGPVMAVYRGTVIGVYVSPEGRYTLIIQHPNDFISSYSDLSDIYVQKGSKVVAGQRIAFAPSIPVFELWRGGAALDPARYITFPIPETIDN